MIHASKKKMNWEKRVAPVFLLSQFNEFWGRKLLLGGSEDRYFVQDDIISFPIRNERGPLWWY